MRPGPSGYEWPDEACNEVLQLPNLEASMGLSRILIYGPVMIPVLDCPEIPPAPSPMPANYGYRY